MCNKFGIVHMFVTFMYVRRILFLYPGPDVRIRKLFELQEEDSRKCVILGTLFKHQELKPSILKEISEEVCIYTFVYFIAEILGVHNLVQYFMLLVVSK
jgi:hypothetical protein